jgi:D-citramalate synthase
MGDGGFDAFMNALGKALRRHNISLPKLADYEVCIPRGGKTDALSEARITWENDQGSAFKTRSVHSNQVFAAIHATIRMLNMQMQRGNMA